MADDAPERASAESLAFERERIALESEKLALERERLEAREARLESLEKELSVSGGRQFQAEPAAVAVAAAALLLVGAAVGAAIGFDVGRSRAPAPRKVLVSRAFLSALRTASGVRLSPFELEPDDIPWMPRSRSDFPETLVLVR